MPIRRPRKHPMPRSAVAILVLLTALAALTSGALNGRVLCMTGAGHVAIEAPHGGTFGGETHCYTSHPGAGVPTTGDADGCPVQSSSLDDAGGDPHGCVDLQARGPLVRELAAPAFDNGHAPSPLPHFLHVPPPLLALAEPVRTADLSAGVPPSLSDLASLRVIVLLT